MTIFSPNLDSILRCSTWIALITWSLMTRPQPVVPAVDAPELLRVPTAPCAPRRSLRLFDSPGNAVHRLSHRKQRWIAISPYSGGDSTDEKGKPATDQVLKCLPAMDGEASLVLRVTRENVRIGYETIEDSLSELRYYPNVGPARKRKLHFKCTVVYDRVRRHSWPIEYSTTESVTEVVYYDRDRLIQVDAEGPAAK